MLKRFVSVPDALLVTGAGAISYGAWVWFEPAGWITGGTLLLVAGLAAARAEAMKARKVTS